MSETLSAEELVAELNHAEGVLPRHVWNQTIAGNWPRIQATIEALQAENAELRKPLLSYDEGGLPVELPAWTPVDAERLEELEAAEAEVTTLRTALEEVAGLLNEMHLPLQGHRASQCTLRTDFCVTAEHVWEALHGRE